MKTLSISMAAHIAGDSTSLVPCIKITRRDGFILGFTANVSDLVYSGVTYRAAPGLFPSTAESTAGRGVDNMTIEAVLDSSAITAEDLAAGLYDDARVSVFLLNYEDLTAGQITIISGFVGNITRRRGGFQAEVRSLLQRCNQMVGKACSALCRVKDLGDSECTVNLAGFTFSGTVTAATGLGSFTTASAGIVGKAALYFAWGKLEWLTGSNAGRVVEVRSNDASSPMAINLAELMPYAIAPGDTFEIIAGCDRRPETCKDKFSNILNFRGEPFVPGNDATLRKVNR